MHAWQRNHAVNNRNPGRTTFAAAHSALAVGSRYAWLMTTSFQISRRAQALTSSAIREILKITERPEVISFAGGLPSPATFPVERMRAASDQVLRDAPQAALQYGPTEGYLPLREWVAVRLSRDGASIRPTQVLITTGSQQGLDLLGKIFIDEGSKVLVETPSYLGALQAFSLFQPNFAGMPSDADGVVVDALYPSLLADARFLYCLPNFQNPTGRRLPLSRRQALVARAAEAGVPIVEDDPYGELYYSGEPLPSLLSMHPDGVIYMGSFSKVLAPGLRLGYVVAPEAVLGKLIQAKQAADLHTPSFTQRVVHYTLQDDFLDTHIPQIRALYARQCSLMLEALERHFPPQVQWNRPDGGMFLWVTLPQGLDASVLLARAIARNVAFVPGAPFFATLPQTNTLRLSFVTVPGERIDAGIQVLGELLREALAELPGQGA
ncbi:PLP-dependent aminotransferase family protein [Xanthomonas campestris pv. raphani]|nr:PLP-dependent aminotransferase family protein [Xanthomonas campestris]MEA9659228.1 PLP-dependent aminotransferase family protein [Xanthomonas campestris pv. raphani]MEA9755853.1 PLP-dependent aminotransferase family protein [Xanthomonas campestris pv. raphani]MEA9763820.1 PLP-dependent aminotransferase family protein [Xanthomonas campestris pv. raphani]MEA9815209.1 PLP-dependent aminotransferase family protein [Xanthomonas campestris pv. raphani]MEA9824827.1 PLP-dependent aminotransferase f